LLIAQSTCWVAVVVDRGNCHTGLSGTAEHPRRNSWSSESL